MMATAKSSRPVPLEVPSDVLATIVKAVRKYRVRECASGLRGRFQEFVAIAEKALAAAPTCAKCSGTKFILNPEWEQFYRDLLTEVDEDEISDPDLEGRRASFSRDHGTELIRCPQCNAEQSADAARRPS